MSSYKKPDEIAVETAIKKYLSYDGKRMWERWYAARALAYTTGERAQAWQPNTNLARMLSDLLGFPVGADEAGRADAVLGAVDDAASLYFVRRSLFINAIAELLERGVDGKVPLSVPYPADPADLQTGGGLIPVEVDGWTFRFEYEMNCREGICDFVLPGSTDRMEFAGWGDPMDEMGEDARRRLEKVMITR